MTTKRIVERAIADIEECRDIHAEWADWYDQATPEQRSTPAPVADTAGDSDWHREWIRRYNRVLRILREVGRTAA